MWEAQEAGDGQGVTWQSGPCRMHAHAHLATAASSGNKQAGAWLQAALKLFQSHEPLSGSVDCTVFEVK